MYAQFRCSVRKSLRFRFCKVSTSCDESKIPDNHPQWHLTLFLGGELPEADASLSYQLNVQQFLCYLQLFDHISGKANSINFIFLIHITGSFSLNLFVHASAGTPSLVEFDSRAKTGSKPVTFLIKRWNTWIEINCFDAINGKLSWSVYTPRIQFHVASSNLQSCSRNCYKRVWITVK